MIFKLYAVKDVLAGNFGKPIMFENDLIAKRWFGIEVLKTDIAKDLELWRLGDFGISTGKIISEPEYVMTGVEALTSSGKVGE